jgi:hypothetical protein
MTVFDTREPAKTLRTSDNAADPAVSWKVKCLNCGAALAGPFCAECGQRALPPHPSVRALVGDALSEFSGWDGKFALTVKLLIRKPGELTRQWLEGRRVHFISPLRLYLTASLLYFLAAAATPNLKTGSTVSVAGINIGASPGAPTSRPQRVAEGAQRAVLSGKAMTAQQRDSALGDIAKAPWLLRPLLTKAVSDPNAIKSGILVWLPRMLFGLIPVYAGILAIFYRRRNYPEHLYFAIHLHAFVFLALTLAEVGKLSYNLAIAGVVQFLAVSWIVAYAVIALRRVYGGSVGLTILKGAGIMTLYFVVGMPTLVLAVFLSAF